MSENPPASHGPAEEPERKGGLLYKLALAGVGGVMLAQEEVTNFFRKREPKGVESDEGVVIMPEPEEPRPTPEACAAEHIDTTIGRVLRTFSVPTRANVDDLSRRLAAVTARLQALKNL